MAFHQSEMITNLSADTANKLFFVGCRTFLMIMYVLDMSCYIVAVKKPFSTNRALKRNIM